MTRSPLSLAPDAALEKLWPCGLHGKGRAWFSWRARPPNLKIRRRANPLGRRHRLVHAADITEPGPGSPIGPGYARNISTDRYSGERGRDLRSDWPASGRPTLIIGLQTFSVNLSLGAFHLCQAVLPHMIRMRRGKIVHFSGGGATSPLPRFTAYGVSKTAAGTADRNSGGRSAGV